MAPNPTTVDRCSHGVLYVVVGLATLWFGFHIFNDALEVRFLKNYLLQWEVSLSAFQAQQGRWPVFSGGNHVAYMDELVTRIAREGIALPTAHGGGGYRYCISKLGQADERIFVLVLHDRLILYGISEKTLERLDRLVDGRIDFTRGRVSGSAARNRETFIGQWQL